MNSSLALIALFVQETIVLPAPPPPKAPDREIVVEAGEVDRENLVVTVDLPARDAKKPLALRDSRGRLVPSQTDERARLSFRVESLKAGANAVYRLTEESKALPAPRNRVTVDTRNPDTFAVLADGKPVLTLQGRRVNWPGTNVRPELLRDGYLHPVLTPSGAPVTEVYPDEQVRHVGIWSFWKELVAGGKKADLWEQPGKTGTTQMESKGPSWSGPVHGGFERRQIFMGVSGGGSKTLLRETWRVLVYPRWSPGARYFLFDIESEQLSADQSKVEIAKANAGGIGYRGRLEWTKSKTGLQRLASEGTPLPERARWAYVGGLEKGKHAGMAVLSPPSNISAPQWLGKGDTPAQPFVNFTAVTDEPLTLSGQTPLRARYRFVVLDGKPDPQLLERLWRDYAFPATVSVRLAPPKADAKSTAKK